MRDEIVELALEPADLSGQELSCHDTDSERYFVSASSVDRLPTAFDLMITPAYILTTVADHFK